MPKLTICKQHLIGWRSWAARRSYNQPRCRAAPSWPCSPTRSAISLGYYWESRLINDHANISNWKSAEKRSGDLEKARLDWSHSERIGRAVLSDGRRNEAFETKYGRRSDTTVGISRV